MENQDITISVLMSVYKNDDKRNLATALKSIYDDQLVKPHEIVLVIDGPVPDPLYKVILEFQATRKIVKVVELKRNVGLGNALNEGLNYCTADYIARMDADDISLPDRFKKQIDYAKFNPDVDVFGSYITEFNGLNNERRVRTVPTDHFNILKMLKRRNPMNHVSVMMKREKLIQISGYVEISLLEDYYLWIRMFEKGYIFSNISESLVLVRTESNFARKRSDMRRIRGWWTLQKRMIKNNMIGLRTALVNMVYITIFTITPSFLKNYIYSNFLRVPEYEKIQK